MTVNFNTAGSVVAFGEAMVELSDLSSDRAKLSVAGDTFNTAVYMARSGVAVQYSTGLGADSFSKRIMAELSKEKIGTDLIATLESKIPGLYAVETDGEGERSFCYWRADSAARYFFEAPRAEEILSAIVKAKFFYFSGITLSIYNAAGREKVVEIIRSIRNNGGVVAFDTNYRPNGWDSRDEAFEAISAVMPFVTVALPTLDDEAALFGVRDAVDCIDCWKNAGAEEVVVKDGPQGAFLSSFGWVPPPEVIRPLDTTGAGDSFNGAYLAARLQGRSPSEAADLGNRQSAEVLMTFGAILEPDPKVSG